MVLYLKILLDELVVILKRKEVGNPEEYFNKNFADYEAGFESRGTFINILK